MNLSVDGNQKQKTVLGKVTHCGATAARGTAVCVFVAAVRSELHPFR